MRLFNVTQTVSNVYHTIRCLFFLLGLFGLGQSLAWANYRVDLIVPSQPAMPSPFNNLTQVATAPDGSVWVVDFAYSASETEKKISIQHFKADGTFITKFGSFGSGYGQFQSPNGIAVAADGSVWVTDDALNLIQHFDAEGQFINAIAGTGQSTSFYGITLAADGSLWTGGSSVRHLNTDGTLISQIDGRANAISLAPDGSIWAQGNSSMIHYQADGTLISQFKANNSSAYLLGSAVTADGSVWVVNGDYVSFSNIAHYTNDGVLIGSFGSKGFALGQFERPAYIANAPDGSLWVIDAPNGGANQNRLQHLKADGTFIGQIGAGITAAGQFNALADIVAAPDGSVWVADAGNTRIQHLNADGTFISQFAMASGGSKYYQHSYPENLALAADGSLWVTDQMGTIRHVNANGATIGGLPGYDYRTASSKVAVAADGSIWTTNSRTNLIRHYQTDGALINEINPNPSGSYSSYVNGFAAGIAVASDSSIWVLVHVCDTNTYNTCMRHYAADGQLITQLALGVSLNYTSPGIEIAKDGSLWLGNAHFVDGQLIEEFSISGTAAEQSQGASFYFGPRAIDIALAVDGSVWVAGPGSRIQKFVQTAAPIVSCDANKDGRINITDLSLIYATKNTAQPAYDLDGDGKVTIRDVRICVLKCNNTNCQP